MNLEIDRLLRQVVALDSEAQRLLATHEASAARTITLEKSYAKLANLSLAQDELFRETLRAVETSLFRAAHVLAWAGFMDFFHEVMFVAASDGRWSPTWTLAGVEDLRDHADFQVIEAGRTAGVFNKTVMKALQGLLNKRNECAHPSDYFPDLNETLGYVSELFQRIEFIRKKTP